MKYVEMLDVLLTLYEEQGYRQAHNQLLETKSREVLNELRDILMCVLGTLDKDEN